MYQIMIFFINIFKPKMKCITFLSYILILFLMVVSCSCAPSNACSNGECKKLELDSCDNCETGFYCLGCFAGLKGTRCVRSVTTNPFQLSNNSLPFNKYAFLTTHNAFAIEGLDPQWPQIPRLAFPNQEDSITNQLQNGVRALMLDTYDFKGDVWLCHSFGGKCHDYTAFQRALDVLKEIEAFLSSNPTEIVTLILEDYVEAPNGLSKVFNDAGLMKYWVPVSSMPKPGQDWPLVSDMVAKNQRLLVFTSKKSKQESEGIAYQWNYMVENQYGDGGMKSGSCPNRGESSSLNDTSKSLVLVNFFRSVPWKEVSCVDNSNNLMKMLRTCHDAAANRWANFVAVDYYKRSEGGGSFEALDMLNGQLLCGSDDLHSCVHGSSRTAIPNSM